MEREQTPYPDERHTKPSVLEFDKMYRTCHMKMCLGRAYWMAVLCLSPDGEKYKEFPMRDKIFCDKCKQEIGLDKGEKLARPIWREIEDIFRKKGLEVPEIEFTKIKWREA